MSYQEDIVNVAMAQLPWGKISGKNILITGATGLIGSAFVEVLMNRPQIDYRVFAMGRSRERFKKRFRDYLDSGYLFFVEQDVTKPLTCSDNYQFIIHAASGASPQEYSTNPVGVMKANLLGTIHLLDYGILHGLETFLFVSSGEVYGEGDGRAFTEEYSGYVNPMMPRSCYPSSKRAAETLCVAYSAEYGINALVARLSHVYGPHFTESDNRVFAQFIRNVLKREDIIMKSTGDQFRSWCYVMDCVKGLLYILLKGTSGQAYNVADSDSNISIKQLAEMMAGMAGRKVVMAIPEDAEKRGYNRVTKSVFSTEKLESLGWSVRGTMSEKIEATLQECKQNEVL